MDLIKTIRILKDAPNSIYFDLKYKFNYYSNKIEGSTFTLENVLDLMQYDIVNGQHKFDDVMETRNSLKLLDFIIDTLGEPITKELLFKYHFMLKKNTSDDLNGFCGCYKKIQNRILGTDVILAEPYEVELEISKLLEWYYSLKIVTLEEIAEFHLKFEIIHPFQDGNGRIGRFLILKQCLEYDISPILITDEKEYRKVLNNNYENLFTFFNKCFQYKL